MRNRTSYSPLASSEIGILWMTYLEKTMTDRMLRYFIRHADGDEPKALLTRLQAEASGFIDRVRELFEQERAAVPVGFGDEDVNERAPAMFTGRFDVSFVRVMAKITSGLSALHLTMSYREDIRRLIQDMSTCSQRAYGDATELLLALGLLSRPPIVSPPRETEFVEDLVYMKGQGVLRKARPINLVESAHLYQQMETNVVGFELMTGFAQTALEPEVKRYFETGRELARDTVDMIRAVFMESDMSPSPSTSGRASESTTPAFSDKLMMYCTNILTSFGLGGNALGTSFSLRSDLPLKLGALMTKVFNFAQEGGKLMIKHGWMEEPPQAENRPELIRS
ncbi:DUF3231 family protein [Paenibacillus antri]|uniref:DUF3231 family protein n=1 Tax=Paenibacillus antri TaxID=2582848 RepID=A0A5R9G3Q5_9BACL|nr:DUF3231 family protein [Paenibacillus antri]TLS51002.1 DUF3231 family protein [Paenibacillus antri]